MLVEAQGFRSKAQAAPAPAPPPEHMAPIGGGVRQRRRAPAPLPPLAAIAQLQAALDACEKFKQDSELDIALLTLSLTESRSPGSGRVVRDSCECIHI